jgi:hypothetical protein
MRTSDSITSISKALAAMQAEFTTITKSGENKFDRYTYANLEDYIKGTRDILTKHAFFIVSSVEKIERLPDRPTQKGGLEHAVQIRLLMRLVHESGEWIEISCAGEGQDRADKAAYKAITGARKYGMATLLGLATSDDPEADEKVGLAPKQVAAKQEAKVDTKAIIESIFSSIRNSKTMDELKTNYEDAMNVAKNSFLQPEYLNKIILAKNNMKEQLMANQNQKEH